MDWKTFFRVIYVVYKLLSFFLSCQKKNQNQADNNCSKRSKQFFMLWVVKVERSWCKREFKVIWIWSFKSDILTNGLVHHFQVQVQIPKKLTSPLSNRNSSVSALFLQTYANPKLNNIGFCGQNEENWSLCRALINREDFRIFLEKVRQPFSTFRVAKRPSSFLSARVHYKLNLLMIYRVLIWRLISKRRK